MKTTKAMSARRMWERVRTVPGLGRNVLVIAVLVAAGIATTGVLLSKTQFQAPWQEQSIIWAEFESAPAVNPEATHAVTIAGVEVGKITDWKTTDRGTAKLKLRIPPEQTIYDNARAVLRSVNPLNEMYVEINPGGPPGKPIPEGGMIPAERTLRPIQPDEVLSHLDERTQSALTSLLAESDAALARAPQQLPGGLAATGDTLTEFRPVVRALEKRREQISQLTTALAQISASLGEHDKRLARLANATDQTLSVLAENDSDLRASLEQLPGVSDQLRNALSATQQFTGELDPTLKNLGRASKTLPPALERITKTAREFGHVVDEAKPVVSKARPVVADLRPFVGNVNQAMNDVLPVTERLDRDTKTVVSYLNDLAGFVYNTSSVFGLEDGQGGFIRGHVVVTLPDGGVLPDKEGYKPSPEESGMQGNENDGPTRTEDGGNG